MSPNVLAIKMCEHISNFVSNFKNFQKRSSWHRCETSESVFEQNIYNNNVHVNQYNAPYGAIAGKVYKTIFKIVRIIRAERKTLLKIYFL